MIMPTAHLYIFSDACPSDWLRHGDDEKWHTIANFMFQSDPSLQNLVEQAIPFEEILSKDSLFAKLKTDIGSNGSLCDYNDETTPTNNLE